MKSINQYITEKENHDQLSDKELLDDLKKQVEDNKASVNKDNADGRYVISIGDKKYQRGFKEFTVGNDLKNEIFVHIDYSNRVYSMSVSSSFQKLLLKYCEEKINKK